MKLIIPENYDPVLTVRETQEAIKYIRDTFQYEFGKELNLSRISAPLYVTQSSGLNDNLNGTEKPVSFTMKELPGEQMEVVHSLAKWKRMALKKYGFKLHEGLYTNMNAIRKDEELDNFHSAYVDQWDWEKIITRETRTLAYLQNTVKGEVGAICDTLDMLKVRYPQITAELSREVSFITAQASPLREASFHRMVAKPSGDRTEYTACSSMSTRLATARARAPPLPPSPVMMEMTGTVRELIRARHWAMASPWPRSSASLPG